MVSSTLNPQAITKNSTATLDSFGTFMTGGSLSTNSPISSAANKVVNFNRPGVSPLAPNINSLISNISTSILNQVDNSIKNTTNFIKNDTDIELSKLRNDLYSRITELQANINGLQRDVKDTTTEIQSQIVNQNNVEPQTPVSGIQRVVQNIQVQVQNVLDNTLRGFSQDYQQKVKGFDDVRPNNVLSKFLDLYQNAIGFVNFFGDRKNINTVEKNLKALRLMFEESFEVAKVLRQTIIKIVKQLSNLPTASPSSGGLNLDIDVPGGRLKQGAGPKVRNIGRIARMGGIAGAGLLGLGGLGMAVTGMGKAKEYQESLLAEGGVSSASGEQYIPENIVESFSFIVDRFTAAVNSLIGGAKSSSGVGSGGTGGGGSQGNGSAPSAPPSSPPSSGGSLISGDASPEMKSLMSAISSPESGGNYEAMYPSTNLPGATKMTIAEVAKRASGPVGRYQHKPQYLIQRAIDVGLDPNKDVFSPENQDKITRGHIVSVLGGDEEKIIKEMKQDPLAVKRKLEKSTYTGLQKYTDTSYMSKYQSELSRYQQMPTQKQTENVSTISTQTKISPANTQTQAIQSRAQAISQPAQQVPQTISLPPTIIDAGGSTLQQSGGNNIVTPPPSSGGTIEVPFLPTSNPDNFLTMYSRMVYNIVDG